MVAGGGEVEGEEEVTGEGVWREEERRGEVGVANLKPILFG